MLVRTGGRGRYEDELRDLFSTAGLRVSSVRPLTSIGEKSVPKLKPLITVGNRITTDKDPFRDLQLRSLFVFTGVSWQFRRFRGSPVSPG